MFINEADILEAGIFASIAASITVTNIGLQSIMPDKQEIIDVLYNTIIDPVYY